MQKKLERFSPRLNDWSGPESFPVREFDKEGVPASELLPDGVKVTFDKGMPQEPQIRVFGEVLLSVLAERRQMPVKNLFEK